MPFLDDLRRFVDDTLSNLMARIDAPGSDGDDLESQLNDTRRQLKVEIAKLLVHMRRTYRQIQEYNRREACFSDQGIAENSRDLLRLRADQSALLDSLRHDRQAVTLLKNKLVRVRSELDSFRYEKDHLVDRMQRASDRRESLLRATRLEGRVRDAVQRLSNEVIRQESMVEAILELEMTINRMEREGKRPEQQIEQELRQILEEDQSVDSGSCR